LLTARPSRRASCGRLGERQELLWFERHSQPAYALVNRVLIEGRKFQEQPAGIRTLQGVPVQRDGFYARCCRLRLRLPRVQPVLEKSRGVRAAHARSSIRRSRDIVMPSGNWWAGVT